MYPSILSALLFGASTYAQFPPKQEGLKSVKSTINPDVELSYKETHICETTEGVKSFSGYVHLPRSALTDLENVEYNINTFFWYFGARTNAENAPLVVYLAGGPGESSVFTALNSETGPCYVNLDGKTTNLNPWSFNRDANVLYIDQPVSAGFSYTSLVNATIDVVPEVITPLTGSSDQISTNATFKLGTFSDQSPWATTNTTAQSARALWHFAEHWLTQFPEYTSKNKNIGVWGNSAGGYWAPATAALWHKKLQEAEDSSPLKEWTIDNMGITNGAIDMLAAMPAYAEILYNNTYQEPLIPEEIYTATLQNLTKEEGCNALAQQCRSYGEEGDPEHRGTNETVNQACQQATGFCMIYGGGALPNLAGRNAFDLAQKVSDADQEFCRYYYPAIAFLNLESTQKALGAATNFTGVSNMVIRAYTLRFEDADGTSVGTGDAFRVTTKDMEYVLQSDIKVSLVYGDRDGRCPWVGAEIIANNANYTGHEKFLQAGYEFITTNDTYQGGAVKQFEKFSFARVFDAGHAVNAAQPETVSKIFSRTINGKDVATGEKDISGYSSSGPQSSWTMIEQKLPDAPGTCMVLGAFQDSSPWGLLSGSPPQSGPSSGPESNAAQNVYPFTVMQFVVLPIAIGSAFVL